MADGRPIVVTAAANGIGLAVAQAFAAHGDRVRICDIDQKALDAATTDSERITGAVCDVSNRAAVEAFVADAAEALGGIDVLIDNAGISGPTAAVEELDPDAWEAVLRVNLTGTFQVTRAAIPHLKRSDAGVILIMSSVGGRFGYPDRSPYATTKRGLIAFAETLAIELGPSGVRVNAIAPGAVAGDRIEGVLLARASSTGRSLDEVRAEALANQSLNHFVEPADIGPSRCSSRPTRPSPSPARRSRSTEVRAPPSDRASPSAADTARERPSSGVGGC